MHVREGTARNYSNVRSYPQQVAAQAFSTVTTDLSQSAACREIARHAADGVTIVLG
jgi:hypothetical protein